MKNYSQKFSFLGLISSFKNALRGFTILIQHEYNLYIQMAFGVMAIIAGFIFHISMIEWAIQTTAIGLVIFSELVNTAIEKTMDLVQPERDERVRDIKDLAGGTVLFTVVIAVATGLFIYIPKLYAYSFM